MQTAGFRSLLDDYQFDFVQGQMPHVEGNWSLHTTDFAQSKLWGYFNLLDPYDVRDTESELLQLAAEEGPYDGILGYSQGGTLAAQTLIRHAIENPHILPQDQPFRFAIFFNTATPTRVFEMSLKDKQAMKPYCPDNDPEAALFYSQMKANPLLHTTKLFPATIDGRKILTDGTLGMVKCEPERDGVMIKMPTLHVRCPGDKTDYGHTLYQLCEPSLAQQYFHSHEHDFPRGYEEMRNIARLIRETAESTV